MRNGRVLYGTDTAHDAAIQAHLWPCQILQANDANTVALHAVGADTIYRYATAVYRPGDNQGITQCTLPSTVQSAWFLLDAAGKQITRSSNGDVALDPGNTAFQQAAVTFLAQQLAAGQFDGVMLDEINEAFSYGDWSASPAKYPTAGSWQAALTSFVTALTAGLTALSYKVTINLACSNTLSWGKALVGVTNRCFIEFWMAGNQALQWTTTNGLWVPALQWAQWLEQNGHEGWFNVNTTNQAIAGYGLASYLLITEEEGIVSAVSDYGTASDVWTLDFENARILGAPLGRYSQVGSVYTRQFAHGTVMVNPTAGTYSITV
jgi:Hypothetical glycosyl hydrolase family 15